MDQKQNMYFTMPGNRKEFSIVVIIHIVMVIDQGNTLSYTLAGRGQQVPYITQRLENPLSQIMMKQETVFCWAYFRYGF